MQVTYGVSPFSQEHISSWLSLFPVSTKLLRKKNYQWFLLERFLFLRKGRYKLTKQWAFPFGICVGEENMTNQNCKAFSDLFHLFALIKCIGCL